MKENDRAEDVMNLEEQEWDEAVSAEMYETSERAAESQVGIEKKAFVIDGDGKADWAVRKIREEAEEYDRIRELGEAQIARIEEKIEAAEHRYNQHTSYLRSLLGSYFATVPHKKTKTQETYRLLSGKLVLKLPKAKAVYDELELIQYLKDNGLTDYIEKKEKAQWGEFKKALDLSAGNHPVMKDTGELVECIRLEETPAEFKVEV